jgi:hypothetical protein
MTIKNILKRYHTIVQEPRSDTEENKTWIWQSVQLLMENVEA